MDDYLDYDSEDEQWLYVEDHYDLAVCGNPFSRNPFSGRNWDDPPSLRVMFPQLPREGIWGWVVAAVDHAWAAAWVWQTPRCPPNPSDVVIAAARTAEMLFSRS